MSLIWRSLRWISIFPMLLLLTALFLSALQAFFNAFTLVLHSPIFWSVLGAFALRLSFYWIAASKGREDPMGFIDTLEHEITHALMGYLCWAPPDRLIATLKNGGEVQLRDSNLLIATAPYWLPLNTVLLSMLSFVIRPALLPLWDLAIFTSFGAFLFRLSQEFRWWQSDFDEYGKLFSMVFSLCLLFCISLGLFQIRGHLDSEFWPSLIREMNLLWNWISQHGTRLFLYSFSRTA